MRAYLGLNFTLLVAGVALLCGCGGGGSGADVAGTSSSSSSSSSSTTTSTTTTTTLSPSGSLTPLLTGVAATGVPLAGAVVRVVDATGLPVGSGTTSAADGAYKFPLDTSAPKMPLFVQVTGVDASGNSLTLYSLVKTNAVPLIANATPASTAVVAQVLGADPRAVFLRADSNTASIELLGNATMVTNASDLVKTIIKQNLTDAKVTSATLDFFQDASFAANKTGLDAVLEALRIQIAKDSSGKDVLRFSNKFNPAGTTEVTVDLATAKAELTKTTGGSVVKAITSALKATTSHTAALTNINVIDDLGAALNTLIAQGSLAAGFLAAPPLSNTAACPVTTTPAPCFTYSSHNGRTRTNLADKLAEYATNNYQLGKLQVTGCADSPAVAKVCVKVTVSALVTDTASGRKIEVFNDAVVYDAKTNIKLPRWVLVGNGSSADFAVYPVAFATYGLNGALSTSLPAKPVSGVQLFVSPAEGDTASRTVQIPSGNSIQMASCNLRYLCVKSSTTDDPVASGELQDTLPLSLSSGRIGNLDSIAGAKYLLSVAGSTATFPTYLAADIPADLNNAPYPMLDGITANPLTIAAISSISGLNLSWANWAAANPGVKVFMARALISGVGSYVYSDALIPPAPGTAIKVPAIAIPAGFSAISHQVWLGAQDSLGRRYYSKFTSTP